MSAFHLTVNVDNAAFDPDPRPELARILRAVAERVESGEHIGHYRRLVAEGRDDLAVELAALEAEHARKAALAPLQPEEA